MHRLSIRLRDWTRTLILIGVASDLMSACRGYAPDANPPTEKSRTAARNSLGKDSRDSAPAKAAEYSDTTVPIKAAPVVANGAAAGESQNESENEAVSVPAPVNGAHTDATALEPGQVLMNGQYTVKNYSSKKCLHVPDAKRENSVKMVQFTCDNAPENKFTVDFVEHKYYRITNFSNSKSLQVADEIAQDEALVEQSDYLGQIYQQWLLFKQEDGSFLVKPRGNPNLCLDVLYGSEADNVGIQLWRDCSGPGQRWLITPVY